MKVCYTAVPTNLQVGNKPVYRMVIQHNGKVSEKTFKARVARRCGYDESVVGCVMDAAGTQTREELGNGYRVDGGWYFAMLNAQGSSDSIREPWDSKKHHLVATLLPKGTLKTCLDNAELVNVTAGATVTVLHVADVVAQTDGTISGTADVEVVITGNGLAIDLAAEDEGVWLEDANGVIQSVATVTEATTTTLVCRFATLPEDGKYTLVVASRNGLGANYGIAMGKRKVTVCAVAGE